MTWSADGAAEMGLVIGAPEAVLRLPLVGEGEAGFDDGGRWPALVDAEASAGGRLLLLARAGADERWTPIALLAFADPLRADVPDALRLATGAGIQVIVVTGDHPATARTIARAAGLDANHVIVGRELEGWSEEELGAHLSTLSVVARAVPEDKLRLVDQARRSHRTVAVTGDGVNDAPALQHGDVAVAMGSGTAVARDASDLVLGEESFTTLMYGLR
jgi:Ca2+-transporting ATPase